MSLIEEALRRAQDPASAAPAGLSKAPVPTQADEPTAHPWPTSAPAQTHPVPQPPPTSLWPGLAVVAILVLAVGLLLGGISWLNATMGARHAAAIPLRTERSRVAGALESHPRIIPTTGFKPTRQTPTPLVLSGVVEGLGEPYAVINGAIVGVGERVGDATVLRIGGRTATIRQADGGEAVLRLAE